VHVEGSGGSEPGGGALACAGREELLAELAGVPFWWHSIDLGDGIVTNGLRNGEDLALELEELQLPDLRGRTVLDIGAWDGYFSFEAERRGATRVVALDHFVWAWDHEGARQERAGSAEPVRTTAGRRLAQDESPACWDPVGLPGKRPFDLAHRTRRSRVHALVADFMDFDLEPLGSFDVALFLGVLYHMRDPLESLRRLATLTAGTAVIETEARVFAGSPEVPMCEFLAGYRLYDDPTNWWAPNEAALRLMLLEAGFASVEVLTRAPDTPASEPVGYRAIVHAHKHG